MHLYFVSTEKIMKYVCTGVELRKYMFMDMISVLLCAESLKFACYMTDCLMSIRAYSSKKPRY